MMDPEQNAPGITDKPGSTPKVVEASPAAAGAVSMDEPLNLTAFTGGQPDDLHDLFTAPAGEEDPLAAMRDDPNYSALIKELEYIAAQARLLFQPAQEAPSDDVWNKIQSQLPNITEDE